MQVTKFPLVTRRAVTAWLSVHRSHKCVNGLPLPVLLSSLLFPAPSHKPPAYHTKKASCPLKEKFPFANGVILLCSVPLTRVSQGQQGESPWALTTFFLVKSAINI